MSFTQQWASWEDEDQADTLRKVAGAVFGAYLIVSNLLLFTAPHLMHQ
ncbi:MAG: hypothetical protein JRC77_05445 [Deltaproteobacteria bacterium]|nr:hypothetical protein [Deltaproteobacteria bacterium]